MVSDQEPAPRDTAPQPSFADPPMMLRAARAGGFLRINAAFRDTVGYGADELNGEPLLHWIHPEDSEAALATIEGRQASCRLSHRTRDNDFLPLEIRGVDHGGERLILARSQRGGKTIEGPLDAHDAASVSGTLHKIAQIVEDQNPGYKCSILLVADGRFVRGAGPSLPEEYNAAIDGFAIGPTVGSCGTAIYWNLPVIVEDIQADPLWAPLTELAQKAGVAACWSHPFTSTTGTVLGALALYAPVPQAPTQEQLSRLRAAAQMTGLAVERGRAEEALRAKRKRELELEEKLRQAAKMESMGTLAGGIAHDFNNLLNTILGFTDLALHETEKGSLTEEYLTDVHTAGQRAKELVKQILTFARQSEENLQPIRIAAVLRETLKFIRSSIPSNIHIKEEIHCEALIMGDATQVQQIFMNLFTNAAHAMQDDGGILAVRLKEIGLNRTATKRYATLPDGDYIEIVVSDNGGGIPPEHLDAIFEPYFTTKPVGKGTGLGLATVYGIIEGYGGKISVDSIPGGGTAFTILLPVTRQPMPDRSPDREAWPHGSEHILVVDDEATVAKVNGKALERLGYSVSLRTSSLEALELFRAHKNSFDLVITDMTMPHMTGDQLAKEMMAIRPDIPIILCTGFSQKVTEASAAALGAKAMVYKPVDMAELARTIRKVLADSERRPPLGRR